VKFPTLTEKQLKVLSAVLTALLLAALSYIGLSPDPELVSDAVEVGVEVAADAIEAAEPEPAPEPEPEAPAEVPTAQD